MKHQAEELGFRAVGSREPQEALEQGCNDEQCDWMCVSYWHSARLFSMGPYLCRTQNPRSCPVKVPTSVT